MEMQKIHRITAAGCLLVGLIIAFGSQPSAAKSVTANFFGIFGALL
jgi:hypothetical protein